MIRFLCFTAIESARIRAGGAARSATNSPTQSASPGRAGTAIVEEEEVTLSIPKCIRTASPPTLNGDVETTVQQQSVGPSSHNGAAAMAPLASVEDVTDSLAPSAPNAQPVNSRSPSRDNPLLIRFRQWTDRFNPLRSTPTEPPVAVAMTTDQGDGPPVVGKSPRLASRKVTHNLSRLFSRSCSRGGRQQSPSPSPEPNQRPSSTSGRLSRAVAAEISRKMSNSLDNVLPTPKHD